MFTIIICDKKIIEDCKKRYASFLLPLTREGDYEFLPWNKNGEDLFMAVPGIKDLVAKHRIWRAIIVNDVHSSSYEAIDKRNPFNICDSKPLPASIETPEEINAFRTEKKECFEKAVNNPFIKLSNWLLGAHIIDYEEPVESLNEASETVDSSYIENVRRKWREEYGRIYPDAVFAEEINRARIVRDLYLKENFAEHSLLEYEPKQVILVSERAIGKKAYENICVERGTDLEYSTFYEDNLYPYKARFMLYDIAYLNEKRDKNYYFNFLVFLNILAGHDYPSDAVKPDVVYKVEAELAYDNIKAMCDRYVKKIRATQHYVQFELGKLKAARNERIDNKSAEQLFEEDIAIPVKIESYYNPDNLYCEYDEIGLSGDCPDDESTYWNDQYFDIQKQFAKYIREPRRAVKTAATGPFRLNNKLEDERAFRLNEYQQENVMYKLREEETAMTEISTSNIFDSEGYKQKMDEAGENIKKRIYERMSRKNTIISGICVLAAFIIGAAPFVIRAFKNELGRGTAITMSIIGLALLMLTIFIMLFIFRHELKSLFRDFNDVVDEMLSGIQENLSAFSRYLGHACTVMREFSVLNYIKCDRRRMEKVMLHHLNDMEESVKKLYRTFGNYVSSNVEPDDENEIYSWPDFDFTKECSYVYDMPYSEKMRTVMFLQNGNDISLPVDYVEKVTMTREDLFEVRRENEA